MMTVKQCEGHDSGNMFCYGTTNNSSGFCDGCEELDLDKANDPNYPNEDSEDENERDIVSYLEYIEKNAIAILKEIK